MNEGQKREKQYIWKSPYTHRETREIETSLIRERLWSGARYTGEESELGAQCLYSFLSLPNCETTSKIQFVRVAIFPSLLSQP